MRVLMQNRASAFDMPGGDVVQMEMTKTLLEKKGVEIDVSLDPAPDVEGYDLVHVFNMQSGTMPHTFNQIANAKQHNLPVALSTIYWNHDEFAAVFAKSDLKTVSLKRKMWNSAKDALRKLNIELISTATFNELLKIEAGKAQQKTSLIMADILLPNAKAELELLKRDFGIGDKRARVIPNAADSVFYNASPDEFHKRYGVRDFVMCAGRIENRKNQLMLIRALRDMDIPLVVIGKEGSDTDYVKACKSEGTEKVLFIEHMEQAELKSAYAAAKVYAQPSWFETPGIANLEAALAGCNLVVTNRGATEEYFGSLAWYCEPDSINSIRQAITQAYNMPSHSELADKVFKNYSWERAAEETLAAYQEILQ